VSVCARVVCRTSRRSSGATWWRSSHATCDTGRHRSWPTSSSANFSVHLVTTNCRRSAWTVHRDSSKVVCYGGLAWNPNS